MLRQAEDVHRQLDEIDAVEAITGVPVEWNSSATDLAKLRALAEGDNDDACDACLDLTILVPVGDDSEKPPCRLRVILPEAYPSSQPPTVVACNLTQLETQGLNETLMAQISDFVSNEPVGDEMLYGLVMAATEAAETLLAQQGLEELQDTAATAAAAAAAAAAVAAAAGPEALAPQEHSPAHASAPSPSHSPALTPGAAATAQVPAAAPAAAPKQPKKAEEKKAGSSKKDSVASRRVTLVPKDPREHLNIVFIGHVGTLPSLWATSFSRLLRLMSCVTAKRLPLLSPPPLILPPLSTVLLPLIHLMPFATPSTPLHLSDAGKSTISGQVLYVCCCWCNPRTLLPARRSPPVCVVMGCIDPHTCSCCTA
jgi:hypothetical protein